MFNVKFYITFKTSIIKQSKFKIESPSKLVQNVNFIDTEEKEIIIREVKEDGSLVETFEMNGVVATRIFKRAQITIV